MDEMKDAILARIDERLRHMHLSDRKASMLATGQPDMIRYIRTRGVMPGTRKLAELASVLEVDVSWLLGGSASFEPDNSSYVSKGPAMIDTTRLREAIEAKGFSQAQLARRVGVSPAAIQQLVNGSSKTSRQVRAIARELGVAVEWLEGEDVPRERTGDESGSLSREAVVRIAMKLCKHLDSANQALGGDADPEAVVFVAGVRGLLAGGGA